MKRLLAITLALLLAGCCSWRYEPLADRAAAGDADAQFEYGRSLLTGKFGLKSNPRQAALWLKAAALRGHVRAQSILGWCYEKGMGVEKSEREARDWYARAAGQGDYIACSYLAKMAVRNHDQEEAVHWIRPLAEAGFPGPQMVLGKMCLTGRSGSMPRTEAPRYLRFAAMQGDAESCFLMALCYAEGVGVPRNALLMEGWVRQAAELGHPLARALVAGR